METLILRFSDVAWHFADSQDNGTEFRQAALQNVFEQAHGLDDHQGPVSCGSVRFVVLCVRVTAALTKGPYALQE